MLSVWNLMCTSPWHLSSDKLHSKCSNVTWASGYHVEQLGLKFCLSLPICKLEGRNEGEMGECLGPAPAGPGIPKGWVASVKKTDTHTEGCGRRGSFFLFLSQLSFYRMNVTSSLSHHILHQILFCASVNIFSPCFSPMHSSRTFLITGFILKCPVHSLLASVA